MMAHRLAFIFIGLFAALNLTGVEMNSRCRLTHFTAGEPQSFNLDTARMLMAVEARAALPGDKPDGEMSKNSWGIEFDNGLTVAMCRGNTDYGSEYNRQTLIVQVSLGDSILNTGTIYDGLSSKASEYHTLKVLFDNQGMMRVFAGCRDLMPALSVSKPSTITRPYAVKCIANTKKWIPAYLWVEEVDNQQIPVHAFDAETLRCVGEGLGGLWQLFDRENDNRYVLPGGTYTLACVPDPDEEGAYLLLVVDGAHKCPELWPAGALKGRLVSTPFKMQYSLFWTAADGAAVEDEAYALLRDDQQLLTLVFPLNHATLRFSRCH